MRVPCPRAAALSVPIGRPQEHTGDDGAANAGNEGDALVRNDSKLLSCKSDLAFERTAALANMVLVVTSAAGRKDMQLQYSAVIG